MHVFAELLLRPVKRLLVYYRLYDIFIDFLAVFILADILRVM